MKKQTALLHMFIILGLLMILHVLVLSGIIPYNQVWGGKLESAEEMKVFETTSILITLGMLIVFISKRSQLKKNKNGRGLNYLIWGIAVSFLLGTFGNLMAENVWEIVIGTTVSLYAAFLCIVIAGNKKASKLDA